MRIGLCDEYDVKVQSTRTASRFLPVRRVPLPIRRAVLWAGPVGFPFALFAALWTGAQDPPWFPLLRYLLPFLVVAMPAVLLRRLPVVGLGLMLVGVAVVSGTVHSWEEGYPQDIRNMQFIALDTAVGFIAARHPVRRSLWAAGITLTVQLLIIEFHPLLGGSRESTAMVAILTLIITWMVGVVIRERAAHAAELGQQAAAQAVTNERLRIARELHDMVAHSISVIAIQAGVGSRVMYSQPEEARRALDAIETTSRDTLTGLQRALGELRKASPGPSPDAAPMDPTPGLKDVEQLAETVRAAGVKMEVWWLGERRPIRPDIDLSAFRIIQEAVTNVVRHAGVESCQVKIEYGDDELALEVCDDGAGKSTVKGSGYGIMGMRERVGLLGGRLEASPAPEGGFRVAALLPLPAGPR
jgi:signal transduction histidine kinase